MSMLRKCENCKEYTLKEVCEECGKETSSAHYNFKGLGNNQNRYLE